MPRKPIDYSKTIIYKLVCKDLSVKDLYVGHTTDWKQRKRRHKSNCNNTLFEGYNYKIYKTIREHGNWDNWVMIEIEKYPCNDEREASARERYWYEQLHAGTNTVRPYRSEEEKKEYMKEYNKEYNQKNKDILSQKDKEYNSRPEVKERRIRQGYEYRARPEVKERQKEYDKNRSNKEERNKKNQIQRGKKYTCTCGSEVRKDSKARHERTLKHQQYIESLN